MKKAKFYHDRMMRGKCETKSSKIRKIYEDNAANKRNSKQQSNGVNYSVKMPKDVFEAFDNVQNHTQCLERVKSEI
jgi:hypothetical protein